LKIRVSAVRFRPWAPLSCSSLFVEISANLLNPTYIRTYRTLLLTWVHGKPYHFGGWSGGSWQELVENYPHMLTDTAVRTAGHAKREARIKADAIWGQAVVF
jgi:hypothetical protein